MLVPIGVAAGIRADPLVTCLLLAHGLPRQAWSP